jgi:hypothetical protein
MEVRTQGKKGVAVAGIDPVLTAIHQRLQSHPRQWLQTLTANPGSFGDVEKAVHQAFQQRADQLVAGLLAQATRGDDFAQAAKKK